MSIIAGVDEAGRGCLAGPVFASAVVLPSNCKLPLMDSKQLSPKKREYLYQLIIEQAIDYSISQASAKEIDEINILQASLLAMKRAILALTVKIDEVLVDGIYLPKIAFKAQAIIKGDSKIPSISAASILAKVSRDRLISQLAKIYPNYQWEKNKAYPTATHLAALQKYGICPEHRLSFAPVKKIKSSRRGHY